MYKYTQEDSSDTTRDYYIVQACHAKLFVRNIPDTVVQFSPSGAVDACMCGERP